ncbi:MAG: AgmX/PglI C-terminal domain-containing protein [Myxococcaceae bacterium]|nr:AgmX/PglI C-terminal domain-containing protein [Myxococcaceae bacterium]
MDSSWLYRQGELILGPVPQAKIIEMLYAGELTGKSEIQEMGSGGTFRLLQDMSSFKVHLAKAEAKHRVDAVAKKSEDENKARLRRGLLLTALFASIIGAVVVFAGKYLAVHTPIGKTAEEVAYAEIEIDPVDIKISKRSGPIEELVDYPGAGGTGTKRPSGGAARPTAAGGAQGGGNKVNKESEDPDGMQTATFDRSAINDVIKRNQPKLIACFKSVLKEGASLEVPLNAVIGNNGRISKLWVDHPEYKNGPVKDCIEREVMTWPFKPFEGESPDVQWALRLVSRKKP